MDYKSLLTEQVNPDTFDIDLCSSREIVELINREDQKVAEAVTEGAAAGCRSGGRHCGAPAGAADGCCTSGQGPAGGWGCWMHPNARLLMAPTRAWWWGSSPEGDSALRTSSEGTEDRPDEGRQVIREHQVCEKDVVVGITASGSAPYVCGALNEARTLGAATIALCNTSPAVLSAEADISILPVTGPEAVMGSTRMKAGTAEKMVLNMLTTACYDPSGEDLP